MSNRTELSRRTLLKVIGGVGASFVLASFPAMACAALPKKAGVAFVPNAFLKLDPDGMLTVTVSRSEMGQGVRTSFAMLVAEEMDVDWHKVRVSQADADPKVFGRQGTGGSSSIRSMHGELRQIGATARAMLVAAAAKQWGVPATECKTKNGKVLHPTSGKSVAYEELTVLASAQQVPGDGIRLKDPSEFQIVGTSPLRVDNHAVVTGTAIFGIDAATDGMVYAVIARPPAFGGTAKSFDDTAARKVAGVIDVQKVGDAVAVIAKNTWAALSGRDALKVEWDGGPNPDLTTAQITEKLKGAMGPHKDMPSGAKTIEASYDLPFLAHATMEPMNALADVKDDRCTVWAPTQGPDGAQRTIAQLLQIPPENVTVRVTLLGGGFGRRSQTDFVREAVLLSKQLKQPVKLLWTREDDMTHDFYRPACQHSLKAALDADGKPVGWSHQAIQAGWGGKGDFGDAGIPYEIPNAALRFGGVNVGVPTGAWRSVENSLLNVANECFIDELAHAAGQDPFEFRKKLIGNERLRNVLEVAAAKSDWGKPLPAGHGRGIACFDGYGSCAAHVVELSVAANKITLHRVVAVVDCGLAVNLKGVEAQMQGACTDGLATALRAAITIDKGGVVQKSWPGYRWMTMDAMPVIEVHIIQGAKEPGGMGETGYPSVPPAVANAIFAATGKRVRKFPIKLEELV